MGTTFVDSFEIDLTSKILEFLNDPADLIRASAVSRSWLHFVIANQLCKKLWLRKVPQFSHIACADEGSDGKMKLSHIVLRNSVNWETLQTEHKIYSSLLHPLSKQIFSPENCLTLLIGASSTDDNQMKKIMNSLTLVEKSSWDTSYWSNKGQKNVPESILYRLSAGVCIVTEVHIQPCEALWKTRNPVFAVKQVRFRIGHAKPLVQTPSNYKYEWTYTSPQFTMSQVPCLQRFKLPEPVVCVGGVLEIELLGKPGRGEFHGLLHIRLGHVEVMGHTLEPAFTVEMLPSGEFLLNYYPRAIDSLLRSFSGEGTNSADKSEDDNDRYRWYKEILYDFDGMDDW